MVDCDFGVPVVDRSGNLALNSLWRMKCLVPATVMCGHFEQVRSQKCAGCAGKHAGKEELPVAFSLGACVSSDSTVPRTTSGVTCVRLARLRCVELSQASLDAGRYVFKDVTSERTSTVAERSPDFVF